MNNIKKCCCTEYIEQNNMLKLACENETYSIYGNLNKGEKIILKYFGKLLPEDDTDDVKIFLNSGYGNLWEEKGTYEMNPCCYSDKKCYCFELELLNSENLLFCFMDNKNNWDLNENSSYMISINLPITRLVKKVTQVTVSEEEYIHSTNNFFKNLTEKLIGFFEKIGNIFYNKIKS